MVLSCTFSGGINLNFIGTDLNSVQRPTFVVYGRTAVPEVHSCGALDSCAGVMILSIFSQESECHPQSSTSLVCTAPSLSGGDPLDSSINYTVVMDNAPGPSNTGLLGLSLVSNPSIAMHGLQTTQYIPGTETPITIGVRNGLSVVGVDGACLSTVLILFLVSGSKSGLSSRE